MAKKRKKQNRNRIVHTTRGSLKPAGWRISQCMIVKNEEKNIERALSWGRDIMYEQIVVDTGSTDRTVEIAESMGAKVYHFEWINDFSAAKNFAIEQASGEWIALLDADEYIDSKEVKNVPLLLDAIAADPNFAETCMGIACEMADLDEFGRIKEVYDNRVRIFRNHPEMRYEGRVHELLRIDVRYAIKTKKFRINHTGYTAEVYKQTNKAARNVELLRAQLEDNPDDVNTKAYLAESLLADLVASESPESREAKTAEIDAIYDELLAVKDKLTAERRKALYQYVLGKYANTPGSDPEMDALCFKALEEFPGDIVFTCLIAMTHNKKGEFQTAMEHLKKCEAQLDEATAKGMPLTITVMQVLPAQMVIAAQGLGDIDTAVKYAEIMLMLQKTNVGVLCPYIVALMKKGMEVDEVIEVLSRVYNFSDKGDQLLVARAAMDCGAIEVAQRIVGIS